MPEKTLQRRIILEEDHHEGEFEDCIAMIPLIVGIVISVSAFAEDMADSIYHNVIIITINDAQPRAKAVAVTNCGRVLAALLHRTAEPRLVRSRPRRRSQ